MIITLTLTSALLFLLLIFLIFLIFLIKDKKIIYYLNEVPENFIYKKYYKEDWHLFKNKIEELWDLTQNKIVKLSILSTYEYFNLGLCNSRYLKVWKKLKKNFGFLVAYKVCKELKNYNKIIENIWHKKYYTIFKDLYFIVKNETASPNYFFYKYYFLFIYKMRQIIIESINNFILPAILVKYIPNNIIIEYEEFQVISKIEYNDYIEKAFLNVNSKLNKAYSSIIQEYKNELLIKGNNWVVDFNNKSIIFEMFPLKHFKKIIFNQSFFKLAKRFKINISDYLVDDINSLINTLKENNVDFDEEYLLKILEN
ncbi:hypothetical protein [Spiroplasma turonicum]|uniref:Uncharacterized protein n=1 Tax=Spiroplasma turonicum TaxID=216946 RepID=A0A0K1P6Q3_9MOLU|nr:hypothetical protein [Spiroplasma turonicum]AKU79552.1 hypothetical protein STURON_00306 [Spiroplasma turonicum]ALX70575.1 hypothetical protein STURO_v1c03070 [Spiroplasma turonicum]